MPSPFPGMDPFIENQEWADFHATTIPVVREFLTPRIGSRYIVRVERRVYLEHQTDDRLQQYVADVAVLGEGTATVGSPAGATAATIAPVECLLPMPEEKREAFLLIRERETREVVTVLELLSPGNKRPGSDGQAQYLEKREAVLKSQSHLVELDLLRGGKRLPVIGPFPVGDYFALLSRRKKRPRAEVYAWPVAHRLPSIPIPLREDDPDVPLDLQAVLDTVYDRARYELSIDYSAVVDPPLNDAEADWMRQLLQSRRSNEA